jgi:putative oxygen-independent coproporphyrinogen III oxidase
MPANPALLTLPPLSLYIHIPWCVQKCPYCDFNSHQAEQEKNALNEHDYVEALKSDLQLESQFTYGRKLTSIFFGGGTPSIFSAQSIATILTHAKNILGFEENIEITLEANPGTFEQEKFSGFYQAGVNRLSIGVQSFNEKHLKTLGRIHNSDEAKNAVSIAKKAGFKNINIDIMHGLPQQSVGNAMQDLQQAIDCSPQHISWYQLTIETNTAFYRQPPTLPHDDILADIQESGSVLLAENGFTQYEVSAFSKGNQPSLHNLNYWQFGDYLGVGAGAHGKITDINNDQIIRRQKTRLPDHYLESVSLKNGKPPKTKQHVVAKDELSLEFMMNALRLIEGVPCDFFESRTGLSLSDIHTSLARLQQQQLLADIPSHIKTTPLGQRFLNVVLEKFSEEAIPAKASNEERVNTDALQSEKR